MKRVRKVISLFAVLCMVFTMNLTAFAASDATPAVAEARNGIIQVRLYYVDDAGNSYCLQTGSGFLLGASSGATTVITNHHVISLTDEDKAFWTEAFGVDFFNSNEINMEARVAVKRDVEIVTSYVNGSEQTDFAILELAQPIYDRAPLKIANSDEVVETQNVYALGFPGAASSAEDDSVYTVEDVTISNGIVGKFQTINNIEFILHNAELGRGNSGGPLVDSNGAVVGVNTLTYADDAARYYSSIEINEIASVLDALGIAYEKVDSTAPTPVVTPSNDDTTGTDTTDTDTTDTDTTDTTTTDTTTTDTNNSTGETVAVISDNTTVVEEEGSNMLLIGGIAAAVVVVAAIIIVVIVMSSKKKSAPKTAPVSGPVPPAGAPVPPVPPAGAPVPPSFGGTVPMMDTGAGETSVLGGGAGETSVLGGGAMQPTATLIRKKNGETALISKPQFIIGKERQKVDFCVPDNNSVSRNHANILCKGGVYYIVDKNSTNYTFVNGNKLNPNQEVKLNSGDKIKLADEEFEFRL